MLWDVDEVCRRTAALLDDPAQTEFSRNYLLPFINIHWDDLSNELSMLGLEYAQQTVVIDPYPALTTSFDTWMADTQPLAAFMLPKRVEWKPEGAPDTAYQEAIPVDELSDYQSGLVGIPEYLWAGGSLQTPASSVDVAARVTFLAMSTQLVDPTDGMVRGCTNAIAFAVAETIYSIRENPNLAAKMALYKQNSLDTFERAAVMRDQGKLRRIPPMHPRYFRNLPVTVATTANEP